MQKKEVTIKSNDIEKNKRIIICAGIILVTIGVVCFLCNCHFSGRIDFLHQTHQKTGEQLGVGLSWVIYLFLWVVSGIIPSSCVMLFMMMVYCFLHRKDKKFYQKVYHPEYEQECDVIVNTSLSVTYLSSAVLFLLYIFGVITPK